MNSPKKRPLITHATNDAARFLGYEITTQFSQHTRKVNLAIDYVANGHKDLKTTMRYIRAVQLQRDV